MQATKRERNYKIAVWTIPPILETRLFGTKATKTVYTVKASSKAEAKQRLQQQLGKILDD